MDSLFLASLNLSLKLVAQKVVDRGGMASLRAPIIRNLFSRHVQRRWAQVHDVRFVATHHSTQVADKYKDKLAQKAREWVIPCLEEVFQAIDAISHESISSLKAAYKEKTKAILEADAASLASSTLKLSSSSSSPTAAPKNNATTSYSTSQKPSKQQQSSGGAPGIKPLSSYLDIEKTLSLPPDAIEKIWRLRHATNPRSICATIPLDTYNRIVAVARQHPQFILPLPREIEPDSPFEPSISPDSDSSKPTTTAAELHFLQWMFHPPSTNGITTSEPRKTHNTHTSTVIFTQLAAFKLHGSYAQPHTILTHHLDLADEKGIVLMNGSVVEDKGVSVDEAQLLSMWLQLFYDWGAEGVGPDGGKKGEILRMFTKGDTDRFNVEELIEEVQNA
ncbi:hypothetical protein FQN57_004656 [Myotisia sp. PD_48]|nr:hypothetical protein FQN57_004656 [Myotisia sp. PD_48]